MNNELRDSILKKNLQRLRVARATIDDLVKQPQPDVQISVDAHGQPSFMLDQESVYPSGNTLQTIATESAGLVDKKNPALILFFGFGLGLHFDFMRKSTNAPIVVYEPDLAVLKEVLSTVEVELENTTLVTNTGHLTDLAQSILTHNSEDMVAGALPHWVQRFPVEFEQFKQAIKQASTKVELDHRTRLAYSAEWINNIAENLPRLVQMPHQESLGEAFKDKPAILVGAGPSLDGSLEYLRKIKGKALICAVHTAVKPLALAGIYPDLAVIIEGQHLVHYFEGFDGLENITLLPGVQTHPEHLELGFRAFMSVASEGNVVSDWLEQGFGIEPLRSSSSVSGISFSFLHSLGCNPLVLVGMDCALTGNRTHAGGSIQSNMRLGESVENGRMKFFDVEAEHTGEINTHEVIAWGGEGTVLARPVYTTYRNWFEGASQTWASDRKLINATEGGARIHGFDEVTLAEVFKAYCQVGVNPEDAIADILAQSGSPDPLVFADCIENELKIIEQAEKVGLMADQSAVRVLLKLSRKELSTVQKYLDQLAQEEEELRGLTRQTRLLNTLVGMRAQDIVAKKCQSDDRVVLTMHSVKQSQAITGLVVEGSRELLQKFRPVIQEIRNSREKGKH